MKPLTKKRGMLFWGLFFFGLSIANLSKDQVYSGDGTAYMISLLVQSLIFIASCIMIPKALIDK